MAEFIRLSEPSHPPMQSWNAALRNFLISMRAWGLATKKRLSMVVSMVSTSSALKTCEVGTRRTARRATTSRLKLDLLDLLAIYYRQSCLLLAIKVTFHKRTWKCFCGGLRSFPRGCLFVMEITRDFADFCKGYGKIDF